MPLQMNPVFMFIVALCDHKPIVRGMKWNSQFQHIMSIIFRWIQKEKSIIVLF